MSDLLEAIAKIKRSIVIRDGKKELIREKEYSTPCKEGYKRDSDGNCVKMSRDEKKNRSEASSKSQNKSSTKRNKAKSLRRRSQQLS